MGLGGAHTKDDDFVSTEEFLQEFDRFILNFYKDTFMPESTSIHLSGRLSRIIETAPTNEGEGCFVRIASPLGASTSTSYLLNIMAQATDIDTNGNKTVLDAIDKLDHKIDTFNEKFDNYQKASQSLVNLAFGLIASATIVTLAQTIFRR